MKTMTDVAKLAGVSQATVSRVVNGDPRVGESTVAAVARAMRELGYEPRKRRHRRSGSGHSAGLAGHGVLAVLMLDRSMETHPSLALEKLNGVQAAAERVGVTLAVSLVSEDSTGPPSVLLRSDLRGVLLWGLQVPEWLREHLDSLPTFWLSSHAEAGENVVLVGNEQAGRLAADYLVDGGVEHPATLFPRLSGDSRYDQRANGFCAACRERHREAARVTPGKDATFAASRRRSEDYVRILRELVERLTVLEPRPDGLFVPDDMLTPIVYAELRRLGIQPGRDIRVVSCGNEWTYLHTLCPRPATIDLGAEATARMAVEQLLREIDSPGWTNNQVSIMIKPQLSPPPSDE